MGPRRAVRVAVVPRRRPATEGALVRHPACRSVAAAAGAPVVEITAGLDHSTAPAPRPPGTRGDVPTLPRWRASGAVLLRRAPPASGPSDHGPIHRKATRAAGALRRSSRATPTGGKAHRAPRAPSPAHHALEPLTSSAATA